MFRTFHEFQKTRRSSYASFNFNRLYSPNTRSFAPSVKHKPIFFFFCFFCFDTLVNNFDRIFWHLVKKTRPTQIDRLLIVCVRKNGWWWWWWSGEISPSVDISTGQQTRAGMLHWHLIKKKEIWTLRTLQMCDSMHAKYT